MASDDPPGREVYVPTDTGKVVREIGKLPVISADQYAHVGRYAGALVMACFEQMGGMTRFVAWAEGNPTDYYTKLLPKMISRSSQVEVSGSVTLDDAISRLEAGDVVDAEFTEIEPEKDWDL